MFLKVCVLNLIYGRFELKIYGVLNTNSSLNYLKLIKDSYPLWNKCDILAGWAHSFWHFKYDIFTHYIC